MISRIKILFVVTNLRHGGTNKSLENLLSHIDSTNYAVDVFVMEHFGHYGELLPNCTILPEDKWLSALIATWKDTKGIAKLRSLIIKIIRITYTKFNLDFSNKQFKKSAKKLLKDKNYNAVIAYSEGVPTSFVFHIGHSNKIAWIHCDYSSYLLLNKNPDETELYSSFKSIVCVSEYTRNEFNRIMPVMAGKSYFIHNLLDIEDIKKKSEEIIADDKFSSNSFTLLTIGSFYPIKRLSLIPDIAYDLVQRNCNFKWYIIANINNTDEFNSFNKKIAKYKIADFVIYLGEKKNPYPYLKKSDLFITLSTTEACPYVVNESKALSVPIVSTDFPSAPEFIENGVNGIITPINNIADIIEELQKSTTLYQKIKKKSKDNIYDNNKLLINFYTIINK